jgi:hypothetical protein
MVSTTPHVALAERAPLFFTSVSLKHLDSYSVAMTPVTGVHFFDITSTLEGNYQPVLRSILASR